MINLNRLAMVCDIDDRPELLFKPFTQGIPEELLTDKDIFTILSKKNVLLYHPYQSFSPVIDFHASRPCPRREYRERGRSERCHDTASGSC